MLNLAVRGRNYKEINMRYVLCLAEGSFLSRLCVSFLFGYLLLGFGFQAELANAAQRPAGMAIDAHTGRILYAHRIDKPHHPASLTKIMTLYLLFEFLHAGRLSLESKLVVTENAANQPPSKLGLKAGSSILVEDAIRALITKSANDVAVTVAENLAGSEWRFAKLMTWKARKFGMNKTQFFNASGLPHKKQITTARDMITLSQRIQKDFPQYYPFFATKHFSFRGKRYKNYNRLMFKFRGVDGIKTGYTRASGFNLTSSVWRRRKHVVAVYLGGKTAKRRDNKMSYILRRSLAKASNGPRKQYYAIPRKKIIRKPIEVSAKRPVNDVVLTKKKTDIKSLGGKKSLGSPKTDNAIDPQGPYHIQIGAFRSKLDAQNRLDSVGSKAKTLLHGHKRFTMQVAESEIFRARFAGFSEKDARKTCRLLKKRSIDCLAVPAK